MIDPSDLYGLPLERFTPERNALAKQLRSSGERDEAARVSKLRKPSAAAWAVNQLVRTQRRDLDKLWQAGDALRKAQEDLLGGRSDPGALRRAASPERTELDGLVQRARGLLSGQGHELSPARLEQVAETLHAAALDPEARERVVDGCLEQELRHVGLGALAAPAGPPARRKPSARPAAGLRARPERGPAQAAGQAERKQARRREAEARRRAETAQRDLERAKERREKAAEALREADEALASARQAAERAARDHRQSETALNRL